MRYEDNSQAGGIAQGQAPDARDDLDALTAGTKTPAEGNVITGEGTKFGPMSSDQADGAHVTKLAGANGTDSSAANGKLSVQGEFGHLTMDAQGNYHYTPKANVPENSRDVFTYTLADSSGRADTADLTIEFGKTPPVVRADAKQVVPGPDGVVVLPEGVQLSDVIVVGRNLVINLPDGTQMVIVDGAVFVPQLVLGGVEVPPTNLASLLIDSEPTPGAGGPPPSSGGNFEVPVPPLDPGVPLGDLIPPTEIVYTPPEVQEVFPEEPDNDPTISIDPGDGVPVINAVDQVSEAGLPERNEGEPAGSGESADGNGTDNDDPSEATTGTIQYDSPDGVSAITINGVLVTSVGQVISGDFGTLVITSIAPGAIGYNYVLGDNTSGTGTHDDFSVTITDPDGDQATATLQVNIVDDVPTAVNDTDSIASGEYGPATGNVITDAAAGDAGDSDNGADTVGADDAHVSAVSGAGGSDSSFDEDGNLVVNGQYGTLTIDADGNYDYVRDAGTPGGVSDVFTYTLTDGDGSSDTATLTINIADAQPVTGENAAAQLDDDALANGNAGGVGDDPDAVNTSGTLAGSGGDGPLTWALSASGAPAGFSYQLQANGDLWVLQDGTHVLTVTLDSANGQYSVEQVAPIDHAAGADENNVNFTVNYTVSDVDGDSAAGSLSVNVDDDTPTIDPVLNREGAMTLDESMPSSAATIDLGGIVAGNDPDLAGGLAIGSANSGSAIVDLNASFGADGPAAGGGIAYALNVTNANSGLTLTDGSAINLVEQPNGVVVGVVDGGAFDGQAAFAISIDPVTGVVTVEQYLSLDHPVNPDPNDPLGLGEGTLSVVGTATDGDGDTVSTGDVDISNLITFLDDGPSVDPAVNADATVTVDESLPSTAPTINLGSYSAGDDPDLAGGLALGYATSGVAIVDANAVFGADGPAAGGGIGYALSITNADSGLTLTDGTPISLVLENGVIIGVVQGGAFDGEAAFAIAIDPATGVVTVEQYLSLDHPLNPNPNDPLGLGDNTVAVVVTATDGDGDPVSSDAIDVSGQITFLDDGPSIDPALNADATVTVDESLPSGEPGIDLGGIVAGNDPDLAGGLAIGQGNSGVAVVDANAVFGADGPAAEGALNYALSITNADSGLTLTDGTPVELQLVNGAIVGVVQGGSFDGQAAFAIAIDAETGVVTVEQYLSLDHPLNPNPNDPLGLGDNTVAVTVTATDGDGDPVTSDAIDISGQITFLDDGPSVDPVLNEQAHVTVDESLPSTAPTINLGSYTAGNDPDLAGGLALGQSTSGVAVVDANAVFGADGPAAGGGIGYTLSILNASSGLTLTDGTPITLVLENGVIIGVVDGGTFDGQAAFAIAIDPATGVVSVEQYLSLDHPVNPDPNDPLGLGENTIGVVVTATDGDGDPVSSDAVDISGQITFLDDGPDANNDVDAILNGGESTDGNVITGEGTDGGLGGAGADVGGADGIGEITGVTSNNEPGNTSSVVNGDIVIEGQYGTLTLDPETGEYAYVRFDGSQGGVSDVFTYTLVDGDGDGATATLTINIEDNVPELATPGLVLLNDDALAGGNPGGTGDDGDPTGTPGQLMGSGGDGDLDYFFSGTNNLPAGFSVNVVNAGQIQILQGATVVLTVTLNNETGAYSVVQNNPIDHAAGLDENDILASIGVYTQDADGDTASSSITIIVDDDTPLANNDSDTVASGGSSASGNVISGVGTVEGAANADLPGADEFDGIVGLSGSGGSDTDPAGGFTVTGTYGSLQMDSDGNYTYTRDAGSPGGVSDTFTYTYQDGDGDTVSATLTINIGDATPQLATPDLVFLDDDALAGGNPGGTDDGVDSSGTPGQLMDSGGDGDLDYFFSGTNNLPAGFSVNVVNAGQIQILQGATVVLTVTLNNETGAYSVVQNNPIDHAAGLDENDILASIGVYTQDADGDTASSSITIIVDDDTPTVSANAAVQLDDETLANGIAGGTGDVNPDTANTSGTLGHSFGADGAGTIAYATTGAPGGFAYELQGNGDLWVVQDGTHVLTLTVNATTGAYTVTQVAPIDHAAGGDENDQAFTINYVVTDGDGDSATGSITINVDDDTPTATAVQLTGTVDEDGVVENGAVGVQAGDGIAGGTGDVAGEDTVLNGNVSSLFNSGADTPLTYGMSANVAALTAQGLTSGGVPLSYDVALNAGIYTLTATAGGETIFTLTVNVATGAYTFTLVDQLDHPSLDGLAGDNTENDLMINLSSILQATDHDGDTVAAGPNALVVTVDDDMPSIFDPEAIGAGELFNEAGSSATADLDVDGDINNNVGADEPGLVQFANISNGDDSGFTSGDDAITYWLSDNGQTLEGRTNSTDGTDGTLIFTVELNQGAGTYTVTMAGEIDNGMGVSFNDLTSSAAGNVNFRGVGEDDPSTPVDLLLSASAGGAAATVNTDSDSIGAANQSMDVGETVRIDFVSNLTTGAATTTGFGYTGHVGTNSYLQTIPQVQGSQANTVSFKVWALDTSDTQANEPDRNPAGGFTNSATVTILEVTVVDYLTGVTYTEDISGLANGATEALAFGISVTRNADGSVTFSGVQEGDQYGINTGGNDFNAVVVEDIAGSFDLGVFSIGQVDSGDPINLAFDLQLTDADGDTIVVNDALNIQVDPVAPMMAAALGFKPSVQTNLSTNTGIVAGAAAAVGLAALPLAAEQVDHGSVDARGAISHEVSSMNGSGISVRALAHDGDSDMTSLFASGGHAIRDFDAGRDASSARALPDSGHDGDLAGASADAAAAKDAGPQVQADHNVSADVAAASQAAPVVHMPSAEALQAADLTHQAASADSVGHVMAEALGLHDAPTVDGLLAHFGSVHDMRAAATGGDDASSMASSVQGWDMGGHMAFAAHADVLMAMNALVAAHHDAVPPAVNG